MRQKHAALDWKTRKESEVFAAKEGYGSSNHHPSDGGVDREPLPDFFFLRASAAPRSRPPLIK